MLDYNELIDLEEKINSYFSEHMMEVLVKLNRMEQLEQFLELIGLSDMLGSETEFESYKTGKIFVVGGTDLSEEILRAVGRRLGISTERFEFCLDYEKAKKYNYRKLQWQPDYAVVLVGPMPHSGSTKGDFSSVIVALEKTEGYPPVYRMGSNELKITKSGLKLKLQELLDENIIVAA